MGHTKPITQRAKESVADNCASPGKYMANLVGDLKSMYKTKGFTDHGATFGKGAKRADALQEVFMEAGSVGDTAAGHEGDPNMGKYGGRNLGTTTGTNG